MRRSLSGRVVPTSARAWQFELSLIFAAWTVFGLFAAGQRWALSEVGPRPIPTSEAIFGSLVEAWLWALATVAVFWMARRFPLAPGDLGRLLAVHMAAAVALSFARVVVILGIANWTPMFPARSLPVQVLTNFHQYILFYWLLLGIATAIVYYGRFRDNELAVERLAHRLAEARLQALKTQLHPHFLFNTLNSVSALIPADGQLARQMVARLGDLLRLALEHEGTQEVTLDEEVEFLKPFLEIEQIRLGDRLRVEWAVDADALTTRVPHLVMQPLVENAIRHGIAPNAGGRIRIAARLDSADLSLEIRNDVPDDPADTAGRGVGLENIRSRLVELYGAQHVFRSARLGSEWVAELRIPRTGVETLATPRQERPWASGS